MAEGYKPRNIWEHYRVTNGEGNLTRPFAGSLAREAAFKKSLDAGQREIYERAIAERKERFRQFNLLRTAVTAE